MINYFYGHSEVDKLQILLEITKEKIKGGKSLLIIDNNEIFSSIEELLIKEHYFYFTENNLKFDLLKEIMNDWFLSNNFCKLLTFQADKKRNKEEEQQMKESLESMLSNPKFNNIEKIYSNKKLEPFTSLFTEQFAKQYSIDTPLLSTLKEEKTCIFLPIKGNSDNKLISFLYLLFMEQTRFFSKHFTYIIHDFDKMFDFGISVQNYTDYGHLFSFEECFDLYITSKDYIRHVFTNVKDYDFFLKDVYLKNFKLKELSKKSHLINIG